MESKNEMVKTFYGKWKDNNSSSLNLRDSFFDFNSQKKQIPTLPTSTLRMMEEMKKKDEEIKRLRNQNKYLIKDRIIFEEIVKGHIQTIKENSKAMFKLQKKNYELAKELSMCKQALVESFKENEEQKMNLMFDNRSKEIEITKIKLNLNETKKNHGEVIHSFRREIKAIKIISCAKKRELISSLREAEVTLRKEKAVTDSLRNEIINMKLNQKHFEKHNEISNELRIRTKQLAEVTDEQKECKTRIIELENANIALKKEIDSLNLNIKESEKEKEKYKKKYNNILSKYKTQKLNQRKKIESKNIPQKRINHINKLMGRSRYRDITKLCRDEEGKYDSRDITMKDLDIHLKKVKKNPRLKFKGIRKYTVA